MAEPSKKSLGMEAFIDNAIAKKTGATRTGQIAQDLCLAPPIGCGKPATKFRDEFSRREYSISGFCQECQDAIFKEEPEPDYEPHERPPHSDPDGGYAVSQDND